LKLGILKLGILKLGILKPMIVYYSRFCSPEFPLGTQTEQDPNKIQLTQKCLEMTGAWGIIHRS
jgi:hypothetical protein